MSWSGSKIFAAYMTDILNNTTAIDLGTDALIEVALYNDSITPSNVVTSANSAYGAGVWTAGSSPNVQDSTSGNAGWPYLGRPLVTKTLSDYSVATVKFDADDTVSADTHTTLAAVYGCLIYDKTISTPVDLQGICYIYFGGTNSVTEGTFTVVWNAAGIFTIAT
jgi:hypothetical protein